MVNRVDIYAANRVLYNTKIGDYHFASQYLMIAHLNAPSNMNIPKEATLLLIQTNKFFVNQTRKPDQLVPSPIV